MNFCARYFAILIITLLPGCATLQLAAGNPEEALRARVTELSQAKTEDDWGKVYDLYDAKYRAQISRDDFIRRKHSISFITSTIDQVKILPSGTEAEVMVKYDVLMMGFVFKDSPTMQYWVKEKGKWYIQMKEGEHPFAPAK
ncbi:MAG: hypothetical protein HY885_06540 [Deltaproteobacteria bacterium]|nr:hypothetical protein [Deltaproteobacteria bacterium]